MYFSDKKFPMKKILFLLIFCVFSMPIWAQEFSVKGKIIDQKTQKPLEAATIFVKALKDSLLISYTVSDKKGDFLIKGKSPEKKLFLHVSYVGNAPYVKEITLLGKEMNVGKILLQEKVQELEGVSVTAELPPVTVKKDTLEFNSDAFKLRPDATVEDLLKKLPGVEVDAQGEITVNGQKVNQILVNGKPFFNDMKIATKNLTKEIVKKIQVTDTKTTEQRLTGQRGDSENKSINIELKKDKNKGGFGRVSLGYGTNNRYEASTLANFFKDQQRLSVIGSTNNINTSGFSTDEIFGMMGGGMRINVAGGGSQGITRSDALGGSYADVLNKHTNLNGNYQYGYADSQSERETFRETTLPNRHYFSQTQSQNNRQNYRHNAGFSFEYKIDSTMTIVFSPSFSLSKNYGESSGWEKSSNENGALINSSQTDSYQSGNSSNYDANISLSKRFGKRGYWSVSFENSNAWEEQDQRLLNVREVYGTTPSQQVRNQVNNTKNRQDQYSAWLALRYPLSEKLSLTGRYFYGYEKETNKKNTLDADPSGVYTLFNQDLSSDFQINNKKSKINTGLEWENEKINIRAGISSEHTRLQDEDFLRNIQLDKTFNYLLPYFNFDYRMSKQKTFRVDYRLTANAPSIKWLDPTPNINNPLHTYVGNPDLNPTKTHTIYLNYRNFDWQTRSGFLLWFRGSLSQENIASITQTHPDLTRLTTYTNLSGDYNFQLGTSLNKHYRWEENTLKFDTRIQGGFGKKNLYSNDLRYATNTANLNLRPSVSYNYNELLSTSLSYSIRYELVNYDIEQFRKRETKSHQISLKTTTFVPKNVVFANDLSFSYLPDLQGNFKKNYLFWNMSLGYKFWEDKAMFSFKVYDLLNQTVDSQRIISDDYVQDSRSLVLKRYFMLAFSYKLRKMGGFATPSSRRRMP